MQSNKKKIAIIVLIVLVVLVAITGVAWYLYSAQSKQGKELQDEEAVVSGIGLYDTYSDNALTYTEVKMGENFITYLKIDGLKNTEVQDSINTEIEDIAMDFYEEYKDDDDAYLGMYIQANFANVLSISVDYVLYDAETEEDVNYCTGLNYNLVTGEKLQLQDIFTSKDAGKTVIRRAVYENIAWDYTDSGLSEEEIADGVMAEDYGEIEDIILEIMYEYNSGKLNDFYFTPFCIDIETSSGGTIWIEMKDYAEYIGIFNRFASTLAEELYEDPSIAKTGMYCLTSREETVYEIVEETDNFYIDLNVIPYVTDITDEVMNRIKGLIDEKYEQITSTNVAGGSFYICNLVLTVWDYEDECYEIEGTYYNCVTTAELWNSTYKPELMANWRGKEVYIYSTPTNYVDISLEPSKEEQYLLVLNSDGQEDVPTEEDAIETVEELAYDFIMLEQEWMEQLEDYGEMYYSGLSSYFTEDGENVYKENAKSYYEEKTYIDENGYECTEYNFTSQDTYQFGNIYLYRYGPIDTIITSVSTDTIEASTTIVYDTYEETEVVIYALTMELSRGEYGKWYINNYTITVETNIDLE